MTAPEVSTEIRSLIDPQFALSNETLNQVMVKFEKEVKKGLKKSTHESAEIKCFVTYVQELPNGTEKGKGGTNFRVLLIHLKGEEDYEFQSKIYEIPEAFQVGTGKDLFDHIAECLANFVKEMKVQDEKLPLGFTFSFPCKQIGLTKGLLIKWTKGFNCEGVVGGNVVELLEDAIARRNDVKILICAILNDTTGTLMSCAWKSQNCKIGVILGTGSNACYVERVANAEFFDKPSKSDDEKVIINTEWGAFGERGSLEFIRTPYDQEIDINSMNPGNQLFEKMLSGMYLGELVRLVVYKLASDGLLFKGNLKNRFAERYSFLTKYVSDIEVEDLAVIREVLTKEMGVNDPSDQDCVDVRYVCESVSSRSAHLVSAALSALILKMGDPNVDIGVDGSVYRFHPNFHDLMVNKMTELLPRSYKFRFILSEDGSGRGAALVAAVATREIQ